MHHGEFAVAIYDLRKPLHRAVSGSSMPASDRTSFDRTSQIRGQHAAVTSCSNVYGVTSATPAAPDVRKHNSAIDSLPTSTDDLLNELKRSPTAQTFCDHHQDESIDLATYLNRSLDRKHLKRIDVIHAAGNNETYGYQIFSGSRHPNRDRLICLALALSYTLKETQRLLTFAGTSELYCRINRDAVIIFCIMHHLTPQATNEYLYRLGEATLDSMGD